MSTLRQNHGLQEPRQSKIAHAHVPRTRSAEAGQEEAGQEERQEEEEVELNIYLISVLL